MPGVLLLSAGSLGGVPVLGIRLHVDLSGAHVALPVTASAAGESATVTPYPQGASGRLFAQYVWIETRAPLGLSASDALRVD